MEKRLKRDLILLILLAALLVLVVINFRSITKGVGVFLSLFRPLLVGIIFAFVLNKPCMFVDRLLRKRLLRKAKPGLTRGIAIGLVLVFVLLLVVLLVSFIIPQLIDSIQILINTAGKSQTTLQYYIDRATSFFGFTEIDLSSLGDIILSSISKWGSSVASLLTQLVSITAGVISFVTTTVIALVFAIYLLSGKETLLRKSKTVLAAYLPEKIYRGGKYVLEIVIDTFNKYIVGQVTEAFILGFLCFLGMAIFRFDYPLLISVMIGVTAFVPVVGAYIGGFLSFVLLLIVSPIKALWFLLFLVVLQQFEGNVIYPRVVGGSLGLPGVLVLLAVVVGGGLGGPAGILLGIPVATVLYILVQNDIAHRKKGRTTRVNH